jgi:hypothetical protein
MMKNRYFTVIIEDISEGKEKGFAVTLPDLHNALVMGENYEELAKGIQMTFKAENKLCDPKLLETLKQRFHKGPASKMNKSVLY